jgi:hypothetical protein
MQLTCQSCDGGKIRKSEETKPCRQTRAAHTLGADWAISLSATTFGVTSHERDLFKCSRSNVSRLINSPSGPSII